MKVFPWGPRTVREDAHDAMKGEEKAPTGPFRLPEKKPPATGEHGLLGSPCTTLCVRDESKVN